MRIIAIALLLAACDKTNAAEEAMKQSEAEYQKRVKEAPPPKKMSTPVPGEAKLPCIADVPPLKTVLVESPTGPTPYGGKAIAENPNVPTAAAIANAIADACGVRLFELPLSAEKIYRALNRKN
jgi:hypothetical protein